jgi:hypothetical protein
MSTNLNYSALCIGILLASGVTQAGTTIGAPTSDYSYYSDLKTITITPTSSSVDPTFSAFTNGPVTSCEITSSTRTTVTYHALYPTSTVAPIVGCTIHVSQNTDGITPTASKDIPITIYKATQKIIATAPLDVAVGKWSDFPISSTGNNNPVTASWTPTGFCGLDSATNPTQVTGLIPSFGTGFSYTCPVTLKKAGDAYYNDANLVVQIRVDKGMTTMSYDNLPSPATIQYGKPFALAVGRTGSGGALSGNTSTGAICTVSPSGSTLSVKGIALGDCNLNGSIAPDSKYYGATAPVTLTVVQADQILTLTRALSTALDVGKTDTITVKTDHISVGSDIAAPVQLTPLDSNICSAVMTSSNGTTGTSQYTVTALKGGTCTLNASQIGNTFYKPGAAGLSLTVNKLSQPITASLKATVTGNTVTSLEINQTGDVIVSGAKTTAQAMVLSRTQTVCKVSGVRVAIYEAGTCTLDVTQPGDSIYSDGVTALSIQALRVPQVITVSVNQPTLHVKETKTLAVTSNNTSLPVTLTPVSGPCTTFGLEVTGTGYGSCVVRASQAGSTYFVDAVPVDFSVFINKGTQTITLNPIASMQVGDTRTVTATGSTTNPIKFSSLTLDTCEIILPNTVKANKIGTCTVGAQQDETTDYLQGLAETSTSVRGAQTISFSQPGAIAINAGPATLSASASSGLTVSLISSTPAYCTVAGNVATLYKVGICSITASQDGNGSYLAATPVTQTLTILPPASTTVLVSSANPVKVRKPVTLTAIISNSAATGSVSFLADGTPINGCSAIALLGGSATCTTSALKPGTRQIVASYSGDANNQSSQSTALPQVVRTLDWLVPMLNSLLN